MGKHSYYVSLGATWNWLLVTLFLKVHNLVRNCPKKHCFPLFAKEWLTDYFYCIFQKTPFRKSCKFFSDLHTQYRNRGNLRNSREVGSTFLKEIFILSCWNREKIALRKRYIAILEKKHFLFFFTSFYELIRMPYNGCLEFHLNFYLSQKIRA